MKSFSNGVAVSRDGSTLLVADENGGSHAIHEFRVADGSRLRVIGGAGNGPLQFKNPLQVWVASDDHVFVADGGNDRVQVLTPTLAFDGFVGVGRLSGPSGVCANDAIIVVSEAGAHRISVFKRGDGAVLRRFTTAAPSSPKTTATPSASSSSDAHRLPPRPLRAKKVHASRPRAFSSFFLPQIYFSRKEVRPPSGGCQPRPTLVL